MLLFYNGLWAMVHKRVRRLVFTKKVTRVHVRKNGKNVFTLETLPFENWHYLILTFQSNRLNWNILYRNVYVKGLVEVTFLFPVSGVRAELLSPWLDDSKVCLSCYTRRETPWHRVVSHTCIFLNSFASSAAYHVRRRVTHIYVTSPGPRHPNVDDALLDRVN